VSDRRQAPDPVALIRVELRGEPVYQPRTPARTRDEAEAIVSAWLSDLYAIAIRRRDERLSVIHGATP